MNFLYIGCMTRRSTRTVIVLSFLSLTTVPRSIRLGILVLSRPALARLGLSFGRLASSLALRLALALGLLGQDGLDARHVASHPPHPRRVLQLAAGPPEAQVELLLLQLAELVAELVGG